MSPGKANRYVKVAWGVSWYNTFRVRVFSSADSALVSNPGHLFETMSLEIDQLLAKVSTIHMCVCVCMHVCMCLCMSVFVCVSGLICVNLFHSCTA